MKSYLSNQNFDHNLDDVKKFTDKIDDLLSQSKIEDQDFSKLYTEVFVYFGHGQADWLDQLGNLTLLDSNTNRSYKNALFPIKRVRIIENDKRGVFVPICTKNVFLKYYSSSSNNLLRWQDSDAEEYMDAIYTTLEQYLPKQGDRNDSN